MSSPNPTEGTPVTPITREPGELLPIPVAPIQPVDRFTVDELDCDHADLSFKAMKNSESLLLKQLENLQKQQAMFDRSKSVFERTMARICSKAGVEVKDYTLNLSTMRLDPKLVKPETPETPA